jgi:N-acetyl-gamma-glutamyl-phosphate reductase
MKKIKVGIIGGAGYTGGELARVLLNHDAVELTFVQSRSQAGKKLAQVHTDLLGVTSLAFVDGSLKDLLAKNADVEAVFLALGHGDSQKVLAESALPASVRIIDLSQDFRLAKTRGLAGREFIYGLPELNREKIKSSSLIANPGCFATAIQLALLPLAKAKKLGAVAVTGITGSTGAGQKLASTSHFSFRANNIQAYKTLTHQHVAEVEESLHFLQGDAAAKVSFVPWRGDFTRGIFVSAILLESKLSKAEALSLYQSFYETHPFVTVTDQPIDLKSVVNTNRALIEVNQEGTTLVIHAAIDNLLKGASGQAIQNFNLMFGLPETQGLQLKGTAF